MQHRIRAIALVVLTVAAITVVPAVHAQQLSNNSSPSPPGGSSENSSKHNFSSTRTTSTASTVTITGKIVDSSGNPVGERLLGFYGYLNNVRILTNDDGSFSATVPSGDSYTVTFYQITQKNLSTSNFEPVNGTTSFPQDDIPDFAIIGTFSPDSDMSIGTRKLPEPKHLNVQTVDESGDPVPNSLARITESEGFSSDGVYNLSTGSQGWVQFTHSKDIGVDVPGPVTVTVDPPKGEFDQIEYVRNPDMVTDQSITISMNENTKPNAQFNHSPSAISPGEQVTFTSTSYDPDGTIDSTYWDFNGNWSTFTEGNVTANSFVENGTYTVRVGVYDDDGAWAEQNQTIIVGETKCPPIIGNNPPKDPDGDGMYEDVNGDGEFNIVDVNALFQNYQTESVQNNKAAFDFNGDGSVNIVDVNALFQEAL